MQRSRGPEECPALRTPQGRGAVKAELQQPIRSWSCSDRKTYAETRLTARIKVQRSRSFRCSHGGLLKHKVSGMFFTHTHTHTHTHLRERAMCVCDNVNVPCGKLPNGLPPNALERRSGTFMGFWREEKRCRRFRVLLAD